MYYFLVPEQFSLQTQYDLISEHPRGGILNIDVTSLARLANAAFAKLSGMKHKFMLSSEPTWEIDNMTARVYTSNFTNALRIQAHHDGLNIRNITIDPDKHYLKFGIGLGISQLFADDTYLLDKNNYEVEPAQYQIIDITDKAKFTECDFFLKPICMQLRMTNQEYASKVTISLKNQIPTWVKDCSYNERHSTLPPANQSYALYEMVEGIYGAFYNTKEGSSKDIFRLPIRIDGYE